MTNSNLPKIYSALAAELKGDDSEVRNQYLKHFDRQVEDFLRALSVAYLKYQEFDAEISWDIRKAVVVAFVFTFINLHLMSERLTFAWIDG